MHCHVHVPRSWTVLQRVGGAWRCVGHERDNAQLTSRGTTTHPRVTTRTPCQQAPALRPRGQDTPSSPAVEVQPSQMRGQQHAITPDATPSPPVTIPQTQQSMPPPPEDITDPQINVSDPPPQPRRSQRSTKGIPPVRLGIRQEALSQGSG